MVDQRQSRDPTCHRRLVSSDDAVYLLAVAFLGGMRVVPASQRSRVISRISPFLARLLYSSNVHSARKIRENLDVVLGPERSPKLFEAYTHRLLSMVVWNSLVINSLPMLPQSHITDLVRMEGTACLDDCLAAGHPVLIWSYHFGVDPLIIATLLHTMGYPVHAITHVRQMPPTGSILQRRYFRLLHSSDHPLSVIDPREGVQRKMLDLLRNKECLYITPDYMLPEGEVQSQSTSSVPIGFLKRKAWLQTGGLRLAKRLKAKVIVVLTRQNDESDRWLAVEPLELPTSGFTPTELQRDLQVGMRRLEGEILAHPYLWLDLKRDDLAQRLKRPKTASGKQEGIKAADGPSN